MTLYEQLIYNWERGFYSVMEDRDRYYRIAHHKCGKDDLIFVTNCYETVKIAIHNFFVGALYNQDDLKEYGSNWKIVDTIHPSELMGKGFQVGDKVLLHMKVYKVVRIFWPTAFLKDAGNEQTNIISEDCRRLKPVLPGEEDSAYVPMDEFLKSVSDGLIKPITSAFGPKLLYQDKDGNYEPVKEAVAQVSEPQKEEKKECEHEWRYSRILKGFNAWINGANQVCTEGEYENLWLCRCGLVTCKNPNQE